MDRWRALCCGCACATGTKEGGPQSGPEEDFLLPGGEWDPSLSHASSRSSRSSTRGKSSIRSRIVRADSDGQSGAAAGDYVPPPVPAAKTLPTFDEFRLLKTVGKGAFGKVMMCVHSPSRILYAMKVVPKAKIKTQKQMSQILAECRILKRIRHPFCVSLQYAFQNDDFLFYVFEFAAGGMLFYHLKQEGRFMEPRARFYFGEIILALEYLHGFGIIFRDLKPENCMLSELGHIILTDFGSAKMLELSEKTTTIAGTPQYLAPEVLRGEPYSFSADWWSCGILLYEMLTGRLPFFSADRLELYKMVLRGDFKVSSVVSPRARALLYRLINKDPDFRLGCASGGCHKQSAQEIKDHSFFSQAPMDPDEEAQYAAEEAERERHREALERSRRSRSRGTSSFMETAGNMIRSLSTNTSIRLSGNRPPYQGVPCEWTWEELERREVYPPFKPKLAHPTDVRHFDPVMTCIPATITDLVTTDRALHLEGFDFVSPDQVEGDQDSSPSPDADPTEPTDREEVTLSDDLQLPPELTNGGAVGSGPPGEAAVQVEDT